MASVCPDATNSQPARNARNGPASGTEQPMTTTTKTPRCTKAEKARRVAMVLRWLAQGCGHAEIVRHAAREWGVSQRQSQNYLAAASAVLAETTEQEANVARAILHARLERLYQFSQTPEGKRLDPMRVLRAISELLGLNLG